MDEENLEGNDLMKDTFKRKLIVWGSARTRRGLLEGRRKVLIGVYESMAAPALCNLGFLMFVG